MKHLGFSDNGFDSDSNPNFSSVPPFVDDGSTDFSILGGENAIAERQLQTMCKCTYTILPVFF